MNQICDQMGEASEEEMNSMMEELGTIQDLLMAHDFYIIDSKVEEIGRALGLDEIGLDKDVDRAFRRPEDQGAPGKAASGEAGHPSSGRAHQLPGRAAYRMAEAVSPGV